MKKKEISKYYLLVFIGIVILLAFLIIKPFIKNILSAIIISYVFYPIYKRLNKRLNRTLSALIVCILVILLVTLPLILILHNAYGESLKIYSNYLHGSSIDLIIKKCKQSTSSLCELISNSQNILNVPTIKNLYEGSIKKVPSYLLSIISERIFRIPKILFNIFIVLFMIYYLLKDGTKLYNRIINILPIKESHQEILFKSFKDVTYAVVYGHIIVAIIQGIIGTIGFVLLRVPSPVLLGSIMTITALIPFFGAVVIWLPASLFLIANGILIESNPTILRGIILLLFGTLIISMIDNFLRPKIIGSKADVHPIIILLGVLGGLGLFGIVGIIIGPVILAASLVMIELYLTRKG